MESLEKNVIRKAEAVNINSLSVEERYIQAMNGAGYELIETKPDSMVTVTFKNNDSDQTIGFDGWELVGQYLQDIGKTEKEVKNEIEEYVQMYNEFNLDENSNIVKEDLLKKCSIIVGKLLENNGYERGKIENKWLKKNEKTENINSLLKEEIEEYVQMYNDQVEINDIFMKEFILVDILLESNGYIRNKNETQWLDNKKDLKIEEMAAKLDEFMYDYDSYEYFDVVGIGNHDRAEAVEKIIRDFSSGNVLAYDTTIKNILEHEDHLLEDEKVFLNEMSAFIKDTKNQILDQSLNEKEYDIEITETLSRTIRVKAESLEGALSQVEDSYKNEEIILSAEDFIEVHYEDITDYSISNKVELER